MLGTAWCIIDSDTRFSDRYEKAMTKAKKAGIYIAASLECFQLSFLPPFRFIGRQYETCSQVTHEWLSRVDGYRKNQAWLEQKNMVSTYRENIGTANHHTEEPERFSKDTDPAHTATCEVFKSGHGEKVPYRESTSGLSSSPLEHRHHSPFLGGRDDGIGTGKDFLTGCAGDTEEID